MNGSSAVNFNTIEKRNMLANLKEMINSNILAPDLERHPSLVLALRPAQATDLILDKEATESDDLLDAFGLACNRTTESIRRSCFPLPEFMEGYKVR
jgi:hypothetical protein